MVPVRVVLAAACVLLAASAAAVGRASAAEWPTARQFVLVEPPPPLTLGPPPSAIAETTDGELLVRLFWPITEPSEQGQTSETLRTRVVRIARDGSRAYVPALERIGGIEGDDEILPLPDGSILFTRRNAIDRLNQDGSTVRFAGTGRFSEEPSGDGGPATAADIGFVHGLSRFPDGSIVFADGLRVRRIAPNGMITSIAGSGDGRFGGDGGPATAAGMRPEDVLPTTGGGFLIADTYNGRVRRVSPQGVISTIAGKATADIFDSSGDGGPATKAGLALPQHLARLPDGSLLIGENERIRRVSSDGTIDTIFDVRQVHGERLGDFAGRNGETIEAMTVTREGGIAVIVSGFRLRALYLAPAHTSRALVTLRDTRASKRRVQATVDATAAGSLRLAVRRRGKVVAHAARHVAAGRRTIRISGRFATAYHEIRVTLRADRGGTSSDGVQLFTSARLPKRLVVASPDPDTRCRRIDARRIDCEQHDEANEESGRPCLNTTAYRLFASGILFRRSYGRPCHRRPMPFDRNPEWTYPWASRFSR